MPPLKVTLTDDELGIIQAAASRDGVSPTEFAHRAVVTAVEIVAQRSAELNRHLE
jgi:hypothetical protein